MLVIRILLFVLLVAAACGTLSLVWLAVRSARKRRLLSDAHATSCDTLSGVGVSVLCSGIGEMAQIENLLSAEYARYEVIVVLDAGRQPDEFAAIAARYRMIGVDYLPSDELPVTGVRRLFRSRRRCFRRLVLIDREQDTAARDFDAAASVAVYDYLLPLSGRVFLLPRAVERLVVEVSERPAGKLDLVCSCLGIPAVLYNRDAVVGAGGFENRSGRAVPRGRRLLIWEPLLATELSPTDRMRGATYRRRIRLLRSAGAWLLAAGIVAAVWCGWWASAAVLLTVALVWSGMRYVGMRCPIPAPYRSAVRSLRFGVRHVFRPGSV